MHQFTYTIKDPLGIHARPAGLLARTARAYGDTLITISKGDEAVRATQLMRLMGMGVRKGDQVTVTAEGDKEEEAIEAMQSFFLEHL